MALVQKLAEEHDGREASTFLFNLGSHFKQAGDEGCLTWPVSFVHPLHLSFPNHVHGLISSQGPPRALEGKERFLR